MQKNRDEKRARLEREEREKALLNNLVTGNLTADIVIPSFRTEDELAPLVCDMEGYVDLDRFRTILTCLPAAAAVNRNKGLDQVKPGGLVIMIDDDISGFHKGWADGMVDPLQDPSIIMVSARLLAPGGGLAYNMAEQNDTRPGVVDVPSKKVASACIAFRNDGTRFYEGFKGSGFEDTWFCDCLNRKYPKGRYVINNDVQLVHKNEKKNQDRNWNENSNIYHELREGKRE